jgi:hypothetical protein
MKKKIFLFFGWKARFDFRTYHFFCSGIVLITLAGTMNTFFHFLLLFYEAKSKEF